MLRAALASRISLRACRANVIPPALTKLRSLLTSAANDDFLARNAAEKGVVTLPSGLQYCVLASSTAADAKTPGSDSRCDCQCEIRLVDGTIITTMTTVKLGLISLQSLSTRGSMVDIVKDNFGGLLGAKLILPLFGSFPIVEGWKEALLRMREGDKWLLTIPPPLAYGAVGCQPDSLVGRPIPANSVIQIELELLKVHGKPWITPIRLLGIIAILLCMEGLELAEEWYSRLPGGYKAGDQVYYTGESETFEDGDRLVHGGMGEVVGPVTAEEAEGKGVAVRFPNNKDSIGCPLTAVRCPPLPLAAPPSPCSRCHSGRQ
jgi:FKBP-type peptidyl-prolyl cis-trans isomerase FklB